MTDKERLEEIKSRVWKDKGTYAMGDYSQREGYIYTLSDYDYEWLIEQAERVEELEEGVKEAVSDIENISPHEAKKTLMDLIKNMEGEI
ncbi:hypothetical protein [Caldifermentibacillus hisashii]|uniref:hypothetical protein n=1 Tax=Caldifermentibacillus hisashii TaxID=996558 RepID=UPI0030EAEB52